MQMDIEKIYLLHQRVFYLIFLQVQDLNLLYHIA